MATILSRTQFVKLDDPEGALVDAPFESTSVNIHVIWKRWYFYRETVNGETVYAVGRDPVHAWQFLYRSAHQLEHAHMHLYAMLTRWPLEI